MKNKNLTSLMVGLILSTTLSGAFTQPAKGYFEPYQKTFIITAYYSPLPGQEFYVTGSLAGDKRLNGNGTNGADGTPVYPGMIAAPSTYGFGNRVSCPGYIDGEIHDRGGAIVKAGVRTNAHDRLDFWAGHGDDALRTALFWGRRTLSCTVYPPGYSEFQQYVSLPNAPKQYGTAQKVVRTSTTSISYGIPTRYKNILSDLGYDPDDNASRIAFQLRHNIISSPDESVAGNIGPQTKAKLDQIQYEIAQQAPPKGLQYGNVSSGVRVLQSHLVSLGYLQAKPTAIFGNQTKAALIQFQLDKGVIENASHPAAGYLGPGTHAAFKQAALKEFSISAADHEMIAMLNKDKNAAESLAKANTLEEQLESENLDDENYEALKSLSSEWINDHSPETKKEVTPEFNLASAETDDSLETVKAKLTPLLNPFDHHLQVGSKGEEVAKIQELLQELGFFEGQVLTNYFGPQTRKAIVKFQIEYNIIASAWSPGAGLVGPKTVMALNASFYLHQFSLPFEVSNVIRAPAVHPNDLKKIGATQHADAGSMVSPRDRHH